jgi:hypothetical protein
MSPGKHRLRKLIVLRQFTNYLLRMELDGMIRLPQTVFTFGCLHDTPL